MREHKPETVRQPLGVLGIAKQSLGRVANELLARNLICQERGRADARQRLYTLTGRH